MTAETEGDEEEVALKSAMTKRVLPPEGPRTWVDESHLPTRAVEVREASVYFARTPLRQVSKKTTERTNQPTPQPTVKTTPHKSIFAVWISTRNVRN